MHEPRIGDYIQTRDGKRGEILLTDRDDWCTVVFMHPPELKETFDVLHPKQFSVIVKGDS